MATPASNTGRKDTKNTPIDPAAPAPPVEATKAPEAPPDLFDIVVDGEKRQLTREQAIRELQKSAAGSKRMQQAAELTKKNQRLVKMLTEAPEDALRELGVDVEQLAQGVLARKAEDSLMTPEERAHRDLVSKVERYEAQEKQRTEQHAAEQQQAKDKAMFDTFEKGFIAAAERNGLEGTPDNLLRMIEIGSEFLEMGMPLNEDQVIAELRDREDAVFGKLEQKVTSGLKGEKLAQRLGKTVVEEILRWSIASIRAQPAYPASGDPVVEKPVKAPKAKTTQQQGYMSESEYMASLR